MTFPFAAIYVDEECTRVFIKGDTFVHPILYSSDDEPMPNDIIIHNRIEMVNQENCLQEKNKLSSIFSFVGKRFEEVSQSQNIGSDISIIPKERSKFVFQNVNGIIKRSFTIEDVLVAFFGYIITNLKESDCNLTKCYLLLHSSLTEEAQSMIIHVWNTSFQSIDFEIFPSFYPQLYPSLRDNPSISSSLSLCVEWKIHDLDITLVDYQNQKSDEDRDRFTPIKTERFRYLGYQGIIDLLYRIFLRKVKAQCEELNELKEKQINEASQKVLSLYILDQQMKGKQTSFLFSIDRDSDQIEITTKEIEFCIIQYVKRVVIACLDSLDEMCISCLDVKFMGIYGDLSSLKIVRNEFYKFFPKRCLKFASPDRDLLEGLQFIHLNGVQFVLPREIRTPSTVTIGDNVLIEKNTKVPISRSCVLQTTDEDIKDFRIPLNGIPIEESDLWCTLWMRENSYKDISLYITCEIDWKGRGAVTVLDMDRNKIIKSIAFTIS